MADESPLFHNLLDELSDPAILAIVDRYLGNAAVTRLRPAIATLIATDAALQQHISSPQLKSAQRDAVTAGDQVVVRLADVREFLAMTATPDGRKSLEDVVGRDGATKAREAATTVVQTNEELQQKVFSGPSLQRVIAGFGLFDAFAAYVGDKQGLDALERTIGPEATKRARGAALELIGVSGRLRALQLEAERQH
jgi:hypothetical protein